MSINCVKAAAMGLMGTLALSAGVAMAQEAKTLDQLLSLVKQGQVTESKENAAREQRFTQDKASQAAELAGVPFFELSALADGVMDRGFRFLFRASSVERRFLRTTQSNCTPSRARRRFASNISSA